MALVFDREVGRETQAWVENLAAEYLDETDYSVGSARLTIDINNDVYGIETEESELLRALDSKPDDRKPQTIYAQAYIVLIRQLTSEPPEWMLPVLADM